MFKYDMYRLSYSETSRNAYGVSHLRQHPSIIVFGNDLLVGNTNDTTSRSRSSIARLLALLVPALAEVVSTRMDNNSSSKNRVLADELDLAIADGALCVTLVVSLEVA